MLICAFSLIWLSLTHAVTLSEVMFDPSGSEGTDEFVELFNDGTTTLNLDGWRITDGGDSDRIIAVEQGLLVGPGNFVLILDPDYLDDGSTTYDGQVPESAIIVTIDNATIGSRGLSNSSPETISLLNSNGVVMSFYQYSTGNVAGFSDEKRILIGPNDSTNWSDSRVLLGTPGGANSLTPPNHDLAISSLSSVPRVVQANETFRLHISIANVGARAAGGHVQLYELLSSEPDSLINFDFWTITQLVPEDTVELTSEFFTLAESVRVFRVAIDSTDEHVENNSRSLSVRPGGSTGGLLLNEVMYSPDEGRAEWVELINASGAELDLADFSFTDGALHTDSLSRLMLPHETLDPDSHIVLAADSTIYFHVLPSSNRIAVYENDFPTLNNSGDSLFVYGVNNVIVDRLDFRPAWGGDTGYSLERLSVNSATNESGNWATSVDPSGSTPCRNNSRMIDGNTAGSQMLELSPNPFTPNGDSRDEEMLIHYTIDYPTAILDLKIYDVRGRVVRSLASNTSVGSSGFERWDGLDDQGRKLSSGMYIIYAEASAEGGSRLQKSKRVATLIRPS